MQCLFFAAEEFVSSRSQLRHTMQAGSPRAVRMAESGGKSDDRDQCRCRCKVWSRDRIF